MIKRPTGPDDEMVTTAELWDEVERLRAVVESQASDLERMNANWGKDRAEVEDLKDQLKFMTLYRDNAVALYRSANVRAWLHGDHSTSPEDLKDM